MRKLKYTLLLVLMLLMPLNVAGCGSSSTQEQTAQVSEKDAAKKAVVERDVAEAKNSETDLPAGFISEFNPDDVPPYSGEPYAVVNDNVPFFTEEDMTTETYEYYSELDDLGRCGVCMACVGRDIMPTEERESISEIKPTGWHSPVNNPANYNRCHNIAFQLTGESKNPQNLITGTRMMNETQIPFENMIADYVKETNNHVIYRVTPIFEGNNLVASGVLMEAKSVEDNGEAVLFNVYCYNVQDGVIINYADGSSQYEDGAAPEKEAVDSSTVSKKTSKKAVSGEYAVNPNNGKIHKTGACAATGTGNGAMTDPQYFSTYEEAENYSEQVAPDQKKRQCGNCW